MHELFIENVYICNVMLQFRCSDFSRSCTLSDLTEMNTAAILRQTMDILKMEPEIAVLKEEDRKAYFEAFQPFDWNSNGKISYGSLLYAMRRAGVNPTEVEVHDIINRLDDGSGTLTFDDFCKVMLEKNQEVDPENDYKESFRVFSKDEEGCIPAEELKFVLQNLPGRVSCSPTFIFAKGA